MFNIWTVTQYLFTCMLTFNLYSIFVFLFNAIVAIRVFKRIFCEIFNLNRLKSLSVVCNKRHKMFDFTFRYIVHTKLTSRNLATQHSMHLSMLLCVARCVKLWVLCVKCKISTQNFECIRYTYLCATFN